MKYLPQEVTLYYLIPSLRREMSLYLKEKDFSNKKIAELLNITPSAVSQYLKNKRSKFYFDDSFKKIIREKTEILLKGSSKTNNKNNNKINDKINTKNNSIKIINELVILAKDKKVLCKIHKIIDNVPKKCSLC